MTLRNLLYFTIVAYAGTACASAMMSVKPLPCPADFTPPPFNPPNITWTDDLPKGATRPHATSVVLPPAAEKGWGELRPFAIAIVDTAGHAVADSVVVCGVDAHPKYAAEIARVVSMAQFRPAMLDGRPIRSTYPLWFFINGKPGADHR